MRHLVADSAMEGLFWLAMAVVWIVVQIISRSARQQMRKGGARGAPSPSRPSPMRPSGPDTSLEDFLRSLGAEPALPPKPVAAASEAEPMRAVEPAPPVRVRKRKTARPMGETPLPSTPLRPPGREAPAPAMHPSFEPGMAAGIRKLRGLLVIPKIPVVNMQGLRVPGLAFEGNTISNLRPGPDRFPLKGRAALRQAMLHRLILEPPHHSFQY